MFKIKINPVKVLHTEFGRAMINNEGYYRITSSYEGNRGKLLHRLIWEKWYGKIPPQTHIHHIDKNPLNNCIWNLDSINDSEHSKLHNIGNNHSIETCLKISENTNKSGYFRVFKEKSKKMNQGFIWRYQYYINGKPKKIARANLQDLEEEVKNRGLEWRVLE